MLKRILTLMLCACVAGCATGGDGKKKGEKAAPATAAPPAEKFPPVSLNITAPATLGETVVRLSEDVGGCLVVMAGLDGRVIPSVKFQKTPFDEAAAKLASGASCDVQSCPNYLFIYPSTPGYEALLNLSLAGTLDPSYEKLSVALTFGFDTPLYEAFFVLSQVMGITIVADNPVAESPTGSMTLVDTPLQDCLEALLKSARVPKDRLKIESTPEYLFLASRDNPVGPGILLNANKLTPEQNALLDKKVTVVLPAPAKDPAHLEIPSGATPLGDVLESLSNQLGIKVSLDKGLDELPVNPCVMNQVRVRTALELLIRQWPLPKYGYEVTGNGIAIKFKG